MAPPPRRILFVLVQSTSPLRRKIGRTACAAAMGPGMSISGIVGLLRGLTGNYTTAFALCVALDLVATEIVLWWPRRRAKLAAS
ncbi:hypothetical protein AC629_19790 [Bradyrhizobium sp. NAS80.1]|uniref:hypothetical protein n=1 Tax=Bradyrhizobium sp. NAS80.1 TaxID=1680159 RepID=UPI00095EE4F0|nr:hypothetical protein AC629_19790 [Bradyrhizobium sp. NAS80.1]